MEPYLTIAPLAVAGVALVVQSLQMVRVTETLLTVVITLVINSSLGLMLLPFVLLLRNDFNSIVETVEALRPWAFLPGLLGSFFLFALIVGYQKVVAATTIVALVSSQLDAGLPVDGC